MRYMHTSVHTSFIYSQSEVSQKDVRLQVVFVGLLKPDRCDVVLQDGGGKKRPAESYMLHKLSQMQIMWFEDC